MQQLHLIDTLYLNLMKSWLFVNAPNYHFRAVIIILKRLDCWLSHGQTFIYVYIAANKKLYDNKDNMLFNPIKMPK